MEKRIELINKMIMYITNPNNNANIPRPKKIM